MRWMKLWLLTTLVATCGQKGPLYLPDEQPGKDSRPEQGIRAAGAWYPATAGVRSSSQ